MILSSRGNRRVFLRRIGLTIGALTFGPDPLRAFVYQKKTISRKTEAAAPPAPIDFRYSPEVWRSPVSFAGAPQTSYITESGGVIRIRPEWGEGPVPLLTESVDISFEGWDDHPAATQKCDSPRVPGGDDRLHDLR